ncbi:hypothetical protein BAE44_0026374 [Dichanthelium oligosanthes]|uniref:DUF7771 domain-containing protein n=1 Tax=Dichanthelium oligosanthes TaxID=888268 RepID=A0A1E5UIA5_9POAL|nr:hypothetical protein BAE44_0026374 [Dichanthelium oligosanthes]
MDKSSQVAGLNRRLRAAVIVTAAIAVAAIILAPLPVAAFQRQQPQVIRKPRPDADNDVFKGCFKTDKNGRKWPCFRINNPAANLTMFDCNIENRMGTEMYLDCEGDQRAYYMSPGDMWYERYASVFDPAPPPRYFNMERTSPKVSCEWGCAGNKMTGVVVWDEQWPEAWSCREVGGDGQCRFVFENNKEVVLVTRAGRRVLGDLPIKECSKNWWGYGGWLPFGLGCTYPKHDHDYYGKIKR